MYDAPRRDNGVHNIAIYGFPLDTAHFAHVLFPSGKGSPREPPREHAREQHASIHASTTRAKREHTRKRKHTAKPPSPFLAD